MRKDDSSNLTVSCVVFDSDYDLLGRCLTSLSDSSLQLGIQVRVIVVNNSESCDLKLKSFLAKLESKFSFSLELISRHGNVGYAKGNNLAFDRINSTYHLILNPDVILAPDTLTRGLALLDADSSLSLVSPASFDYLCGPIQYLCKRYPSFLVLFLRFIKSPWLNARFSRALSEYEYRQETDSGVSFSPEIVSGCFMLCRTSALKKVGGFDERFFLYFEDFDLSLRMGKVGKVVYLPEMKIQHYGGGAGRKGWKHVRMFIVSAAKFFHKHGLKWI
ncbi:glycosyltransferase family 2 protein [Hahella chejuensis]|uniref:glycosyltransferase family 2 protein n=1 Tax=Hahella chejuensis TaxID=158327 RepID=UPI00193091DD|nr:glycosyltransferase family 2 protein [Hahella chejuensis]